MTDPAQPPVAKAAAPFVPSADADYQVPGVAAGANPVKDPNAPPPEQPGPRIAEALKFSEEDLKQDKEADPAETPPAAKDETHCKHCRRNIKTMLGVPKPTEEEKERWLRHVLGEPRFTREYVMMSGRVRITLVNRTRLETEMVYRQLTLDVEKGRLPAGEIGSPLYYLQLNRLMMVNSLRRLELVTTPGLPPKSYTYADATKENYPPADDKDTDTPLKRMDDRVATDITNEAVYSMLLAAFRHFEALVTELTERADDLDFYKAVAGQGS